MAPNMAKPERNRQTFVVLKVRLRKSASGRIGCATRRSTQEERDQGQRQVSPAPPWSPPGHAPGRPPRELSIKAMTLTTRQAPPE